MRSGNFLALVLSLLLPLPTSAQWTASAYVGTAHTSDADLHVSRPPDTAAVFEDVGFEGRSFRPPLYYGLRGGYMFQRWAGLEAEFIHVKAFAQVEEAVQTTGTLPGSVNRASSLPPAILVPQYNVSHGLNLLFANLVLQQRVLPRLDLCIRAGVGIAIPHPEIRAFGEALDRYERHGVALQFSGGANFSLTRWLFWLGEYKFTTTSPRFEIGSATIENAFRTHQVVSGLGIRF